MKHIKVIGGFNCGVYIYDDGLRDTIQLEVPPVFAPSVIDYSQTDINGISIHYDTYVRFNFYQHTVFVFEEWVNYYSTKELIEKIEPLILDEAISNG